MFRPGFFRVCSPLLVVAALGSARPAAAQIDVAAEEREAHFASLSVPEIAVRRHLLAGQEWVVWLPETWAPDTVGDPQQTFFEPADSKFQLRLGRFDFDPGSSILQTAEGIVEGWRKIEKVVVVTSGRRLQVAERPAVELCLRLGEGEPADAVCHVLITDPGETSYRLIQIRGPAQEIDQHLRRLLRDFTPLDGGHWSPAFERTRKSLGAAEQGLACDRRNRLFAEIAEPDALGKPGIDERLLAIGREAGAAQLVDGLLHLHPRVRIAAFEAMDLKTLADPARARLFAFGLMDPDPAVRFRIARGLAAFRLEAPGLAAATLAAIFDADNDTARTAAFQLLAALPPRERAGLLQQSVARINELPARSQVLLMHLVGAWTSPEIAEATWQQVAKRARETRLQALAQGLLVTQGQKEALGLARERLLRPLEKKPLDLVLAAQGLAVHTPPAAREGLVPLLDAVKKAAAEPAPTSSPPGGKGEPSHKELQKRLEKGQRLLEEALRYLDGLPAGAAAPEECALLVEKPVKPADDAPPGAAAGSAASPAEENVDLPDWKNERRKRLGCPKSSSPELAWLHLSRPGGVLSNLLDRLQELQVGAPQHNDVYHAGLGLLAETLETWHGDPFSVASTGLDLSAPLEVAWWASGHGGELGTQMTLRTGDAERLQESMLRLTSKTTGIDGLGGGLLAVQVLPFVPMFLFQPWEEERALRQGENDEETAPTGAPEEEPQSHLVLVQGDRAGAAEEPPWGLLELAIDADDGAVFTHTRIGKRDGHLVFQMGEDPAAETEGEGRVQAEETDRLTSRLEVDLTRFLHFMAEMGDLEAETEKEAIPEGLWLRVQSDLDTPRLATRVELEGLAEEYLAATTATRAQSLRAPIELLPKDSLAWLGFNFAPSPLKALLTKNASELRQEMGAKNVEKLLAAVPIVQGEAGLALVGVAEPEGPKATDAWKRHLVFYLAVDPVAADRYLAKHGSRTEKIGQWKAHRIGKALAVRLGNFVVLAAEAEILKSLGKPPFLVDSEAHREILARIPEETTLRGFFDTDLLADALVGYLQARREEGMSVLLVELMRALGRVGLYVRREEGRLVGEVSIEPRRQPEEARERSRELSTYARFTSGSVPTHDFPTLDDEKDLVELDLELQLPKGLKDPKLDWSNERLEHQQVEPGHYHLRSRPALALPETSPVRLPIRAPELLPYLRNEDQLDLHLDAVRKQAEKIRGKEEDPARIVRAIVEWAHLSLEYSVIRKSPRVEEILKTRKADCTEFTQLTIALARSLGIPARPVGGIHVGPDGAILHRWAEVYLDRWYEIDSTFGVVEVPATSLRLPSDDGTLLASVPGSRFVFLRGKKGDGSEVLPEPPPASNE